ncbi:MAG TPA: DNA-directed RNA polymerase subunit alpha C-terminal domain-containing protein [Planctomycetaceae bacterium]|nr:DNA-directed RNA polymerase subunit alpha C-terminal domain-containing protein [Planctomycetaceae bacterium]
MSSLEENGVIATKTVNVHELFQASSFGPQQIKELEAAIAGNQYQDVRDEVLNLEDEIADGKENPQVLLKVGIAACLLGRHQAADQYLSKVSNNGLGELYHARVLVALDRPTEAIEKFESAEKHGADAVDSRLGRAGALRMLGRLDEAEKLVHSSAPMGGATRAEYCYQMGCILSDRGDTYGAVEYFERAVDMDPHHSRALFSLAGENLLRGNDEDAIRLYERSLSKPPLHLGALMNLGLLYEDTENYPAAAYCFRRVLDIFPNHGRARLYLKDIEAAHDMYYDEESQRNAARLNQILATPVTDFELSVRSRNCLQKMGVRNLGDLTRTTEQELLAGKNFGETSLHEIKFMLESRGLKLGQAVPTKEKGRDLGYRAESLSPQEQAMMSRPVADLNLSVRARKCMSRLGITTLGELTTRTPDELLESKNFGVTSLNEVRQKLSDLGMKLRND